MISWSQKVKHSLTIFNRWEYAPLCLLIGLILVMHFATIMQPSSHSLDETYYVPAANSILHGESLGRIEHPPLGQSIIASGIWIFGDNPLGWRFFSVIFGTITLILFYLICRKLNLSKYIALLATTLLAVDNLSFVQSGVAMLDVYCLTFMFASVLCYLKKRSVWSGVFIGLAVLSKLTGVFALLFIFLYSLITNRKDIKQQIISVGTSILTFLGGLVMLDAAILHEFQNPIERIKYMFSYTLHLTFGYYDPSYIRPSRPWEWLFHLNGSGFNGFDAAKSQFYNLYLMIINPAIWSLIIPGILFLIYLSTKQHKPALFALCWFSATYIIWIPINLITNRLTYDYYFYPAVGAVCIGIALLFSRINEFQVNNQVLRSAQRIITPLYLGISILFFVFLYFGNVWFRASWAIILFIMTLYYLDKFTLEEPIRDNSLLPKNTTLKP